MNRQELLHRWEMIEARLARIEGRVDLEPAEKEKHGARLCAERAVVARELMRQLHLEVGADV
jgi:hypothetical protein